MRCHFKLKVTKKLFILMSFFFGHQSFGVSAFDSDSSLRLPERFITKSTRSPVKGNVRFTGSHFMTDKRSNTESENYGYLGGNFRYEDESGNFDWVADAIVEVSANEAEEFYVGAPELFVRLTDDDSEVQVTVGRQRRTWSEFDQRLALGIWQPQLRWDYLDPIQQGLTGAFFDLDVDALHMTLFASPIFLPDQGPQFRLNEGRFESPNRWFWQPQTRIRFANETSNLYYNLETPRVEEIVMNPSLGAMMQVDPEGPLFIRLAYAYKPMNQFFLGIECSGCVDPVTTDSTATVHPLVVNHHVLTMESSWIRESDRFLISWTMDRPVDPNIPADWWAGSELKPVSIPGVSYENNFLLFNKHMTLGADYFREISDGRSKGEDDLMRRVESSGDRYSFQDLLSLTGRVELYSGLKRKLHVTMKYAYSFEERGSWLNSRLSYTKDQVETFLGFDVLGSETDPLSSDAGLFSRYRTNDRVYTGVGYVF